MANACLSTMCVCVHVDACMHVCVHNIMCVSMSAKVCMTTTGARHDHNSTHLQIIRQYHIFIM
jgi:hypothetical protein